MSSSRLIYVEFYGTRVPAIIVRGGIRKRKVCQKYSTGRETCWIEHYLRTYLPKDFAELKENEILIVVKVPRDVLEKVRGQET